MRAKDKAGDFRTDFDSYRWGRDYAEGSAWQSSFAVFHDFAGLIAAHGGKQSLNKNWWICAIKLPIILPRATVLRFMK